MFRTPARRPPDHGKTQITDTAPCQKSLRFARGRDTVEPVRGEVLAEFQKQAALPGFRKGKAPVGLIQQQYAKPIEEETLHRVTRRALEQAAKEHALKPVVPFEVSAAAFTDSGGLTLEATVEVEPAFALAAYKGIPLTKIAVDVNTSDVDQALAKLQESMAQLVPAASGEGKERQGPALDDELAKDLGSESLGQLRAHVEAKLREQRRTTQAEALEAALCAALLARHPFGVPPRLVRHQAERLTRELTARPPPSAPSEVRKLFDAEGLWGSVVSSIRQEKTIAMLLSAAAVQESATSSTAIGPITTHD